METNRSTVELAIAGDEAAVAELLRTAWTDAYRLAYTMLRDRSAAEDAAQEACARAWSAIRGLRTPEVFAAWFYRIVVNECKRFARRRERDAAHDKYCGSQSEAELEDRIDMRRAIARLNPRLRMAVVLRYYYDLDSIQIARIVGSHPVTIRWRIMRAHQKLAEALRGDRVESVVSTSEGKNRDGSVVAG